MSETEQIFDKLIIDTAIVMKWSKEEQNQHIRDMLINIITLSYDAQKVQLHRGNDGFLHGDFVTVGIAVGKMADIYRRSENNSQQ